jgi:hypothetical protein
MRATATLLDQVGAAIRNDYAQRTGLNASTVAAMMDDETWMDADEAVAKRFCDSLMVKPAKATNLASPKFNLCAYANAPQTLSASSREKAQAPAPSTDSLALESQRLALLSRLAALG